MALTPQICTEIEGLLAKAKDGQVVGGVHACLNLLEAAGLAWRAILKPQLVGVHPTNRDGLGLNSSEVHHLLTEIANVGFSSQELKCICFEVARTNSKFKEFNTKLFSNSRGMLAPMMIDQLRYASVSGSHVNACLNCIAFSVKHDFERITTDGLISLAKVGEFDPALAAATMEGLPWLIISSAVDETFPDFASIVQSSCNVSNHLARTESEVQLLRKIWLAVKALGKTNVSWPEVSMAVLRSKPVLSPQCPQMFTFVVKFSGGEHGHLLETTEQFVRAYGFGRRSVGGEIFDMISVDLGRSCDQHAVYRHCSLIYLDLFLCMCIYK